LRAYFAFKMGLPFGYSKCTRGGGGEPPKCHAWWNIQNEEPPPPPPEPKIASGNPLEMFLPPGTYPAPRQPLAYPAPRQAVPPVAPPASAPPVGHPPSAPVAKRLGLAAGFGHYLPTLADGVHSGSGRTAASDDNTDYYPVPLNEETLRPGTVYADPYGHLLVLARRLPQSGDAAGVFFAVDAQPDGTVAR
jgi:hypothetical protein